MDYTFADCENLKTATAIPGSVTNMYSSFRNCTSLTEAPVIAEGVENMHSTFEGCTSLTKAATIPSTVTNAQGTFWNCTNLAGTIEVNANPTYYSYFLKNTGITEISGTTAMADELLATK